MVCALTIVNKSVPANSAPSAAAGMAYSLRILCTRSVTFLAPSFFNRLARWKSMVRGLMPSLRPASLLEAPRLICASVIRSLGVKVSSPGKGFRQDVKRAI
jgi:hypothetical protein